MNIRSKLTIIIGIIILLSVGATGSFVYMKSSNTIMEQTRYSLLELVKAEKNTISGMIEKEEILPDYLTVDSRVLDLLENQDDSVKIDEACNLLMDYYSGRDNIEGVFLLNEDFIILANAPERDPIGWDLSDREFSHETSRTKQGY